jgi:adhesin/invasin
VPAEYTFTAADAGVHTFVKKTILRKRGKQTLTVTDTLNSALTATVSINNL